MKKHGFFALAGVFLVLFIAAEGSAAKSAAVPEYFLIITPPQNFKTFDSRIKIAGSIKEFKEDSGRLKINGKGISTDKNGAFGAGLVLHPGKNAAYIGFVDEKGVTRRTLRKILRVVEFVDINNLFDGEQHWAKKQIKDLATLGIIEPFPDGAFLPNNDVTKGEFATWLSRALSLPLETADRDVFYDVPREHWRAPFIQSVMKKGYMKYSDGAYFGVDEGINRIDAVAAALKADGIAPLSDPKTAYFEDISINDPRNSIVSAAAARGLTIGISKTSHLFDPDRNITRAESVSLLSRLRRVKNRADNIGNWNSGFFDEAAMCSVNSLPAIVRTFASPESVFADGRSSVCISALVRDQDGQDDVSIVKVDLTQFGGPPDAVMYDDGTHGDISLKDGFFTLSLVINADVAPGRRSAAVTVVDRSGATAEKDVFVNVFPPRSTPIILSAIAYPPAARPGGKVVFAVKASDPAGLSDIDSVFADLRALGGKQAQQLFDDGTLGDVKASDGVYMLDFTIPAAAAGGEINIPIAVKDKAGDAAAGNISILVRQR